MTKRNDPIHGEKFLHIIILSWIVSVFLISIPSPVTGTIGKGVITSVDEPFGTCHAGYSMSDLEYNLLKNIGNQWMRIDFSWNHIEPVHGQWNFAYFDAYLATAANHSQKVLAILDYDTNWLNTTGPYQETRPYIKPEYIPFFLEYVNQTVRRYKDRVAAFEIWNEPNIDNFWKGPDEEFFQLFNASAELIHSIDPEIIIVGGVLAGHDPIYLRKMFDANIMSKVDVISFHPYSTNAYEIYEKSLEVRAVGESFGFTGEYWITEVGNPTGGLYGHRVTEHDLSNHVIQSLIYATITNIDLIIWYCLFDSSDAQKEADPTNSEWYFGLVYPNYTLKPGAYAFKIFSERVSNSQYRPDLISVNSIFYRDNLETYIYRRSNGETTFIFWFQDFELGTESLDLNIELSNAQSRILQYNIYDGTNLTISENSKFSFTVGKEPVILTYNASSDSDPILITIQAPLSYKSFIYGIPISIIILLGIAAIIQKKQKLK
jgi:hypothetical protein